MTRNLLPPSKEGNGKPTALTYIPLDILGFLAYYPAIDWIPEGSTGLAAGKEVTKNQAE